MNIVTSTISNFMVIICPVFVRVHFAWGTYAQFLLEIIVHGDLTPDFYYNLLFMVNLCPIY